MAGFMQRNVRRFAEGLLKHRWAAFTFMALLVSFSAFGLTKLRFDTTFRAWQPPGAPQLLAFDEMIAKFGNDDSLMLAFKDDKGVLTNHALGIIHRITEELWRIDAVKRVDSLTNFSVVRAGRVESETAAVIATADYVVAAGDDRDLWVWDRKTWTPRRLTGHDGQSDLLALSPDQKTLYSAGIDRGIRVFDLASGELRGVMRGAPETISALTITADGARVIAGSYKTTLVFDAQTFRKVGELEGGEDFITELALAPDGDTLFTASKTIEQWSVKSGQKIRAIDAHAAWVTGLVISKDGQTLYSADDEGTVTTTEIATGASRHLLHDDGLMVVSMLLTKDGKRLVIGCSDGTVRAVPVHGGVPVVGRVHDDWVIDLVEDDSGRIFSASRDRNVSVHVPGQGPEIHILAAHRAPVRRVLVDRGQLFSSGDDGDLYVWDAATLRLQARLVRSIVRPVAAPEKLVGTATTGAQVKNLFRYPIEIRVAGETRGVIGGGESKRVDGIPVPAGGNCTEDAECGTSQYCDFEADQPVCLTRASVEAYFPGTDVRIWAGETVIEVGRASSVQVPPEETFASSDLVLAPLDQRSRVGALKAAFPGAEDQAALAVALPAVLGESAADADVFFGPSEAGRLVEQLRGTGKTVSPGLIEFLATFEQFKLSPLRLPITPARLREQTMLLVRGPRSPAVGAVINDKQDTTVLLASLHLVEDQNPLREEIRIRGEVEKLVAQERAATGYDIYLAGDAIQDTTFQEYAERDLGRLFPLFILTIVIILLAWYRRPSGVVLPLGLILCSITVTMGISAHLGAELNNMTVTVPQVVLACTIGDANHIFNHYLDRLRHGDTREGAIIHAIETNFVPCFWTSITTTLGFLSMVTASIVPIGTFGWMAAIGSTAAWIGTFTLLPCVLSLLPVPKNLGSTNDDEQATTGFFAAMDRRLMALSYYVNAIPRTIVFMGVVLVAIATYGSTKISFDTNQLDFFSTEAPYRKASTFVEENLTGPFGIRIMVDTGEAGGVRKTKYLEEIDKLQRYLESQESVTTVAGLGDIQKSMNRVMNSDLAEDYRIPETDAQASAYYTAYTFSLRAGMELTNRVSADESATLIDVRLKNHPSGWIIRWGHDVVAWAKVNTPALTVTPTGKAWLYAHMMSEMAGSFFQDVSQAVITISFLLLVLARSIRLGILAMLVNITPVFVTIGFIALFGITIDLSILVSVSVAMGIVVDDTIHYVAKYKRLIDKGVSHDEAAADLAREHSKASVATMLILIGGFAMFLFTDYMINRNFGATTATMLGLGAFLDLFLLPAMLKLWGPARVKMAPLGPSSPPSRGSHTHAAHGPGH